jgi:DNA-directed RNA polymerase subunit H (RpoH/RPB5)
MWVDLLENKIDTPLVCWNNDDDFTTIEFLKRADEFLSSDSSYSMAIGEHVQFGNHTYGKHEFLRKDENLKNATARLEHYFKPLFASPHGVVRKQVIIDASLIVLESLKTSGASLAPIRFWDKIFNYVAAIQGNKKTINYVSSIRSNRHHWDGFVKPTGAVLLNSSPPELEGDTPYKEILNRIKVSDPLSSYLESKTGTDQLISQALTQEVLQAVLSPYPSHIEPSQEILLARNTADGKREIALCLDYIKRFSFDDQ